MADIFLSYAREDRPSASRLAAELTKQGWSLFWDRSIPVGQTFDQYIETQLDAAGCIIVLWSQHSVSSNWVKAEASEGARREILHPVLIEDVKLPLEFRRLQTANLVDWRSGTSQGEFDELVSGVAAIIRSSRKLDDRLQEARVALGRGDHAGCLEILQKIGVVAQASGLGDEVAELRRTAEAPQNKAPRQDRRRQHARAERQWEAIAEAVVAHRQAEEASREHAPREEIEGRAQTNQARDTARAARNAAEILHAAQRAPDHWQGGESKFREAETALAGNDDREAKRLFDEAARLYESTVDAARDALQRQRQGADAGHARMAAEREAVQGAGAALREGPLWSSAEASAAAAEAAYQREQYDVATEAFEKAADLFQAALHEEGRRRQHDDAQAADDLVKPARSAALDADAPRRAAERWQRAEGVAAEGHAAFASEQYQEAAQLLREAMALYKQAEAGAREAVRADEARRQLEAAEHAHERLAQSPRQQSRSPAVAQPQAQEPAAPPAVPSERTPRPPWRLGGFPLVAAVGGLAVALSVLGIYWFRSAPVDTSKMSRVQPSESAPSPTRAQGLPTESNRAGESAKGPGEKAAAAGDGGAATDEQKALARSQEEAGRLQTQAEDSRRTAAAAQAEKLAGPQWTNATRLHQAARAAVAQGDHDKAGKLLQEAITGYGDAVKAATTKSARIAPPEGRDGKGPQGRETAAAPAGARADAEQARTRMVAAKRSAEQVAAGFFANKRFAAAQSKESDGLAALKQSDYAVATRLLDEARAEYEAAMQEARQADKDRQVAPAEGQPGAGSR